MLRALRRTAAAFALAALFAGAATVVLAAEQDDPPRLETPRPGAGHRNATRSSARRAYAPVQWRRSASLGRAWAGSLVRGVQLPAEGRDFFTWDPIFRRSPNRSWRRWGSDRLVRLLLRLARNYRAVHPDAPRLAIGDLSRPRGGDFGPRYGLPGHVSHQNGLDVDVYYPRLDGREQAPRTAAQIDRALAQELVDSFVAAGAVRVFVGPRTGLRGPPGIVQVLAHHDNHLHVRLPQ